MVAPVRHSFILMNNYPVPYLKGGEGDALTADILP